MKKIFVLLTLILAVYSPVTGLIDAPPVLAFPTAEGFGANSLGGRGGNVYIVSNTADSGAGSLRECVQASGARTCLFSIGGLITLTSKLTISNPYITIAGQTSPGGGITIKGEISVQTHDVVIRYISVRRGSGGDNHAIQVAKNGTELYNVIIDHVSLSWGTDSVIETWYRTRDVTFSWLIISEGLDCSSHSKGCHSKGLMIGGYKGSESGGIGSENISVINNLMAHSGDRNPLMQLCGVAQVVGNTTYNSMYTFSHQQLNCPLGESYVNWVNNYHKKGISSTSSSDLKIIPSDDGVCEAGKFYSSGNYGNATSGVWSQSFSGSCAGRTDILVGVPATAPSVQSLSAVDSYTKVLSGAGNSQAVSCDGNWYNRRDTIDARIVNDVKNGTGSIIDDPSEVGGWVVPAMGTPCVDSDKDGIPDNWEVLRGLNPNLKSDGNSLAPTGYTWLEEFINGRVVSVPPTSTSTSETPTPVNTNTPTPTSTSTSTVTPSPFITPTVTPSYGDCRVLENGTYWFMLCLK